MSKRLKGWIDWGAKDGRKRSERVRFLARSLEVTNATIYNYIKGESRPSLENAVKIERITDGFVKAQDFVEDDQATCEKCA
jgi:predicted transcriptional regulator